jgi:hypothetical protein
MKYSFGLFTVLLSTLSCIACSKTGNQEPVVVHVFRDPSAHETEVAIREISQSRLVTPHNRPILIATQESKSYREGLTMLGKAAHPDLIILNSADDATALELKSLVAIKSGTKQLFGCVPPWTQGEERTAANQVLSRLQTHLETDSH